MGLRRVLLASIWVSGLVLAGGPLAADSTLVGDLPRADERPLERIEGLDSIYGVLPSEDGTRLRTILTKPEGHTGRLPAILFVQWLSCDTIELPESARGGWSRMMRRVARESGLVMMRTDKRGVGDSEGGPCSELDYLTELADHRAALRQLRESEFVDPERIVIFGASMGGNYAPLVARGEDVAGVIVWGGGAKTWFERMMVFERHYRELTGQPADSLAGEMKEITAFLHHYLVRGLSPRQIAAEDPALGQVWGELVGTNGNLHYGRPLSFHQQAQQQDWAGAWNRIDAPALILYGEYDWFEDAAGHELIARIVNRNRPGTARFRLIPRMDHHFSVFPTAEDAARDRNGTVAEDPVVREILAFLSDLGW